MAVIPISSLRHTAVDDKVYHLWTGPPIPADVEKIPFVEGLVHRTIHRASKDGYKFLHGAAIVEDLGGGNVPGNAPHVPAPTRSLLGADRGYRDFYCDTNQYGGAVVKSETGRVVAVGMPSGTYTCSSEGGNATVKDNQGNAIEVDHGGAIVDDAGDAVGQGGSFSYCMVAKKDSAAVVVNADGVIQSTP